VITEGSGTEITSEEMWEAFATEYLPAEARTRLAGYETSSSAEGVVLRADLAAGSAARSVSGNGNGPISALVHALRRDLAVEVEVLDYAEHALGAGEEATAVAYVEVRSGNDVRWGVGMDPNITTASMKAILSALDRLGVALLASQELAAAAE
jgi:2-isopropylmalate synthase